MLNPLARRRSFGFSLIELLVGIVIMVILATLAMPSFQTMLRNSEIRNAAESIANGLQRARAEAVARNANIEFVLGAGSSWTVDYAVKPVPTDPPIDSRLSSEGSRGVSRTVLPAGATTITFTNLGVITANADASATLAQVDVAAAGGNQDLRVTIGVGGNAKMCDPALAPGSSPRAC